MQPSPTPISRATATCCVVFALIAAVLTCGVLTQVDAGLDFSDEGFYLNWLAQPFEYQWSISHFGYVYRPLYLAVGGDVALLRACNLLVLLALSWMFHLRLLSEVLPQTGSWCVKACLALAFSTAIWLYLDTWLPTPNYNTLALSALLIGAYAALGIHRNGSRTWIDMTLLGCAAVLAFLAKPTCAVALGAVVLLHSLSHPEAHWRRVVGAGSIALAGLLLAAISIDGSPQAFIDRIGLGLADLRAMDGGYKPADLLRLDQPALNAWLVVAFVLTGLCSWASLRMHSADPGRNRLFAESLVFLLVGTAWVVLALHLELRGWQTPAFIAAAIPATAAAVSPLYRARGGLNRIQMANALLLLLLPFVYSVGTNNNLWWSASKSAVFWIAGAVPVLAVFRPPSIHTLLRLAAISHLVLLLVLVHSAKHPYRQPTSVFAMSERVHVGGSRSQLRLAPEAALYVREIQRLAEKSGFTIGQPILDLTGRHPGTVFAMGGRSVGRAWMIGSYPGRDVLARAVLRRVDRSVLEACWILTETDGLQQISPDVLDVHGLALERDFERVGTVLAPTGTYSARYEQTLYAPKRRRGGQPQGL